MVENFKIIRDSIHGDIKIDGIYLELLGTPELQRLYNIKQLGLAHLVFPGAHHTRLEHSLGTYNLARRAAEILHLNKVDEMSLNIAAFLHDIGHGPFSHTLEKLIKETLNVDHIDLTEKLISGEYKIFDESEKQFIYNDSVADVLDKNDVDKKQVIAAIRGIKKDKAFLSQLLDSAIDVDQLDYLIRDAYYTGVAYGVIDIQRFLQTLDIFNDALVIKRKGVSVVENILMARALMYSSIYFHKTVRIAELMLSKAIDLMENANPYDFFRMTDGELLNYLKNEGGFFQREIATKLKYRNLFKQAYAKSFSDLNSDQIESVKRLDDPKFRRLKEKKFEEKLGIPSGHVIIDVPYQELHQSEPRIDKTDIMIHDENGLKTLDDFTPTAEAIRNRAIPDWMIMIITDEKHRDIVKKEADSIIF